MRPAPHLGATLAPIHLANPFASLRVNSAALFLPVLPMLLRSCFAVRQNEWQLDFVLGGVKGGLEYAINQRNTAANQVG